jgi:hypothetical protein
LLSIFATHINKKSEKKEKKTIENMLEENKKYINEKNILEHPGNCQKLIETNTRLGNLTMYFQGIKALLTEKFNLRKEIQN